MAFFSKLKKAKEAAAEHKKEAVAQEAQKPKVPYKHIPVHAGADALSATPSTIRSEELRERIAAARRNRAYSSASAPSSPTQTGAELYQSVGSSSRSRPSSIPSSPSHSRNASLGKRTNSDLSISTMMQSHQETPSRGRQPARRDYFSHQNGVPAVPQVPAQHRAKTQKTVSSRSSVAKRRSPLSAMSITEDDEAGEHSSSSNSQASDGSVASSQSSATEISRPNSSQDHSREMTNVSNEQNYSRPLSTIASAPATPDVASQPQHKKHQSVIEVSSQPQLTKRKSMKQRFSLFSRKSMVVAAH
ncbi:hypothetical protein SLS59_004455 [Nothophoma quercina]|uniref:Uncharacterized protein n=1 Tax=Nothophoma quercina TaxID=749835 RepID=A0ABR3RGT9_9PLEO